MIQKTSFGRDNKGFSILEIVIAMGLAAGLLLFYMRMQNEQPKNSKTIKVNQEVETFFSDFRAIVRRGDFCSTSFEKLTLKNSEQVQVTQIKNALKEVRYEVGKNYSNDTVKLTSITLKDFKPDDVSGYEGTATLEVKVEKLGNIYGTKTATKDFELTVSRDPYNVITACRTLSAESNHITIALPGSNPAPTNTQTPGAQPTSSSTPTPTPTQSISQEEMMKQIQNDPMYKQMQEALQKLNNGNPSEE